MTVTAKYENGVFKPIEDVKITEGTIVEVLVPAQADRPDGGRESVGDFAFFGLWKDRTDLGDSVDYINKLRREPRN
jgi:hypothetical protein